MTAFHVHKQYKRRHSGIVVISSLLMILLLSAFIVIGATFNWYQQSILPLSESDEPVIVTIELGATAPEIGELLEEKQVIRSARAFEWYTRINNARSDLQAGGYAFKPSESVQEIVKRLRSGDTAKDLFTILPAQRLDQIRTAFMQAGYSAEEITEGFNPRLYSDHPALAFKPQDASLEGYLYPESFQKNANTTVEDILRLSLDQTEAVLTPALRQKLQDQGLNVHEAIIMASIVEREVSNQEDRRKVAQVFLKRYREGMMLGSDPTALYGALLAGIEPSVFADTPYNTRLYEGLPPGPINNVSAESLQALTNPADTEYLYFVSGDDGKTYFSFTLQQHEALTAEHCKELCRSY